MTKPRAGELEPEPETEPEQVGAGCFWLLEAGAACKKNQELEPEPEHEPLGKKGRSRSWSRYKISRLFSPARR